MARPSASTPSARLRILACASDLFYRKGVNHVGINEIIDASGVAKMTLYHHFSSKNDIITAVLEARRVERLEGMQAAMDRADSPRSKILAAFDYLDRIIGAPQFRGCAFINATVELAEPGHPASLISTRHKQRMISQFEQIAEQAGWRNPRLLAVQCQLLWDGATAAAQISYDGAPVQAARSAIHALIDAASQGVQEGGALS